MKKDSIHSVTLLRRWCHRLGRLLPLLLPVLAAACQSGEDPVAVDGPYNVRLLIDPQSASTRADGDVSAIHQLRVYVFNTAGKRVGYYENMALTATGQAYYVPFRLTEGGELTFYVVANEGGASRDSSSSLTEDTPLKTLQERAGFLTENIDRDPGDLMTGWVTKEITNDQLTTVNCPLSRPFSLLNVFFAKSTGNMSATVTSVKLCDYSRYGHFKDRSEEDYGDRTENDIESSDELLPASSSASSFTVNTVVAETEQKTGDYGKEVICKPMTLDKDGSSVWDKDKWENITPNEDTEPHPRLEVTYTINGNERTENIYLPPISQTNTRYNVKCLIKQSGGLTVSCAPQPWKDAESDYVLSESGAFVISPVNMHELTAGEKNYATQYGTDANASARQFTFTLQMTFPEGVRWQAHLTNPLDFEFVKDENHHSEGVGGSEAATVTLQVRPTKAYDASVPHRETDLYITIGTAPNNKQMFDTDRNYGDGTQIHIVQVSPIEGDNIVWGNSEQPEGNKEDNV